MEEKNAVYEAFGRHFITDTKPRRHEIKLVWENSEPLKNRTLDQVVTFINNITNKKQRIPSPIKKKIREMVSSGKCKL